MLEQREEPKKEIIIMKTKNQTANRSKIVAVMEELDKRAAKEQWRLDLLLRVFDIAVSYNGFEEGLHSLFRRNKAKLDKLEKNRFVIYEKYGTAERKINAHILEVDKARENCDKLLKALDGRNGTDRAKMEIEKLRAKPDAKALSNERAASLAEQDRAKKARILLEGTSLKKKVEALIRNR